MLRHHYLANMVLLIVIRMDQLQVATLRIIFIYKWVVLLFLAYRDIPYLLMKRGSLKAALFLHQFKLKQLMRLRPVLKNLGWMFQFQMMAINLLVVVACNSLELFKISSTSLFCYVNGNRLSNYTKITLWYKRKSASLKLTTKSNSCFIQIRPLVLELPDLQE